MKVLHEGYHYELENFDKLHETGQCIQFIHKEPASDLAGHLETIEDGTTNEEVFAMLIDRMKYLQAKFPCKENACCITHLEEGLMWLEKRTKERQKREVEGKHVL
jgi:hypothetical protein